MFDGLGGGGAWEVDGEVWAFPVNLKRLWQKDIPIRVCTPAFTLTFVCDHTRFVTYTHALYPHRGRCVVLSKTSFTMH